MNTNRCKPEHKDLLVFILLHNPGARKMFRLLCNLGAHNMRPDYITFQTPTGKYERCKDPGAWYADCRGGSFVCMLNRDGDWTLHS
jgi:hypothetical protein